MNCCSISAVACNAAISSRLVDNLGASAPLSATGATTGSVIHPSTGLRSRNVSPSPKGDSLRPPRGATMQRKLRAANTSLALNALGERDLTDDTHLPQDLAVRVRRDVPSN